MAEEDEEVPQSLSPLDDFDPLKDDVASYSPEDTLDDHSDHTGEADDDEDFCESSSIGYSTTPPANVRQERREKERSLTGVRAKCLTHREYRLQVGHKKAHPRSLVNVIKEEYGTDPYLSKLSGTDSEDNIDTESFQERRDRKRKTDKLKKQMTKSRVFDRFSKRLSEGHIPLENMALEGHALSLSMPTPTMKVDSPSRSLNLSSSTKGILPLSGVARPRREAPVQVECPQDRVDFHKLFSTLINLGSQARKERKPAKRQMSTEQEVWQRWIFDVLWLEIHAWFESVSPAEQEKIFANERINCNDTLQEILNFRIEYSDEAGSPGKSQEGNVFRGGGDSSNPCSSASSPVVMGIEAGSGGEMDRLSAPASPVREHFSEPNSPENLRNMSRMSPSGENPFSWTGVTASFHSVTLTSETVKQQKEAMVKVQDILEKLDRCEHLYPSMKAFAKDNELYGSPKFTQRIKSLCLWLNITRDLCHKIRLMGRVVGVHNMRGVDWPLMDFETPKVDDPRLLPRPSIPDITETVPTSEEEEESDAGESGKPHGKQVKFLTNSDGEKSRSASPLVFPDTSTPMRASSSYGLYSACLSRASSEASLDESCRTSQYRHFVDKSLKKMGMPRVLKRFWDLLDNPLQRAKEAMERPRTWTANCDGEADKKAKEEPEQPSSKTPDMLSDSQYGFPGRHQMNRLCSRTEYGVWSSEFISMGLPSFRPSYLFLVRIPLDVIHECLRFRLEQKPANDPSFLSIRQLILECKEVLRSATKVKQYYQHMVAAVMWDDEDLEDRFSTELESFDATVTEMLEVYFGYLQSWMQMLQSLAEASRSLQDALEEEWSFTKQICPHIIGGEAEAGKKFSTLASSLLSSISDFLESGIDEHTTSLYDLTSRDDDPDRLAISRSGSEEEYEEEEEEKDPKQEVIELRHSIQKACRNFKNLFHEARERASKALGFAKMLRKDLEIAADFNIAVTTKEFLDKLHESDHAQILLPLNAGYLMFIPKRIMQDRQQILLLLNVTCGREDNSKTDLSAKSEGYLLLVRCDGGTDRSTVSVPWQGPVVKVETKAETAIALSHIAVEALFLVVTHSTHLASQRELFMHTMGKTVDLVNEQTSCHQAIAESLDELRANAIDLTQRIVQAIKQVDGKLNLEDIHNLEENERSHIMKLYKETMLQCYNFGFEYHKEMMRLMSAEQRQNLGKAMVDFAKDWISFVCQNCERGRGVRPRWASHGFDFLAIVCHPSNLAILTCNEFQALKKSINDCITHVIGTVERSGPSWSPTHTGKGLPKPGSQPVLRLTSWPEPKVHRSMSTRSVTSEPPASLSIPSTPSPEIPQSGDASVNLSLSRRERIQDSVRKLEEDQFQKLHTSHVIGQLTNRRSEIDFHINVRRVNFRWQRGIKIGEGQFGKVYTAVNIDTGVLMAMKEMKIQPTDHQDYKMIADEIKNFEGIRHENLVQYYGVEIHKDEMLIFMEFCDRGTIEETAKLGLPENMIRRYTREILIAVAVIHENNIIHRDLKGANIFITSSGKVKVGDFGCSLKLKTNTMPGEIHLVGTTAFMAPEVITQNNSQGHGRSADIWSVGCVVIEMATGKRPWHEAENNYQIMFKVGMGAIPPIPDTLSEEGQDFLTHCFQHDPALRYTASQLLDHPFTKVYEEEEKEKEKKL